MPVAAELKMRAGLYRQRHAGAEFGDLFLIAQLAPHAPISRNDVPDFLDRVMGEAFDTAFGGSEKSARPPRDNWHSARTSEPSGAIASGALAMRLVSKLKAVPLI
jgi:hypothetical protein